MSTRVTIAWILAGIVSMGAYVALLDRAQPESGVPLTVTRLEALDLAETFLQDRDYNLEGFEKTVGFRVSGNAKQYFEKNLAADHVQRIMAEESPVFYWICRWYRPMEKEAYYVWVSTEGHIWGFNRILRDDTAAPSVDEADVEAIARAALAEFEPAAASTRLFATYAETHANRTDHFATFVREDLDAGEAEHRITVVVQGDEVGAVAPFIHLPEYLEREEQEAQAYRGILWQVSDLPSSLFQAIMLAIFLIRFRDGKARYRFALILGTIAATIATLDELNGWATAWLYYPSTDAPGAYTGQLTMSLVETFLSEIFYVSVLAIAADGVWRTTRPNLPALDGMVTREFWAAKPVFASAIVGLSAACIHAGFFSTFYVFGKEWFGLWSPQQSPYHNLMSGALPWASPLATGFLASIREELLYRVIMVGVLLRVFKIRSIAIIIPAVVWAFLHSLYPQEPVYIRGVELTCIGIFYGAIMLRYGPLAPIISHFGYNTLVSGTILFRSGDPYYQVAGALVFASTALPLVPGLWAKIRGSSLITLPPQTDPPIYEITMRLLPPSLQRQPSTPFSTRLIGALTVIFAIVFVAVALLLPRARTSEESLTGRLASAASAPLADGTLDVLTTPQDAEQAARKFAEEQGIDLSAYTAAVAFRHSYSAEGLDYLYGSTGQDEFYALRDEYFPDIATWRVRFYIPGQEEEWNIRVLPDGTPYRISPRLPDEHPGAKPTVEEARTSVVAHIRDQYNLDAGGWEELDHSTVEHDDRVDHTFVWRRVELEGGGSIRSSADVIDGMPVDFRTYVEVPEDWSRERAQTESSQFMAVVMLMLLILALLIPLGMHAVTALLMDEIEWRRWLWVGGAYLFLFSVLMASTWDRIWIDYPTSVPTDIYQWRHIVSIARNAAQSFLFIWPFAAMVHAIGKRLQPNRSGMTSTYRALALGGFASFATLLTIAMAGTWDLFFISMDTGSKFNSAPSPIILGGYISAFPVFTNVGGWTFAIFIVPPLYIVSVALTRILADKPKRTALVGACLCGCFAIGGGATSLAIASLFLFGLITLPILVSAHDYLEARLVGDNLRARVFMPLMTVTLIAGVQLMGEPDPATRMTGIIIVAVHVHATAWGTLRAWRLDAA